IQGIIGAFAVRIPVSYLMSMIEPVSVFRVGLATPCSTVVQIILCGIYFIMMLKEEKRTEGVF
ncbi:MAG: MATE family efflux transporter, partial [Clostridia bacterium]|nr:MATE family efflux transporter [Clostridia bacterium]